MLGYWSLQRKVDSPFELLRVEGVVVDVLDVFYLFFIFGGFLFHVFVEFAVLVEEFVALVGALAFLVAEVAFGEGCFLHDYFTKYNLYDI